MSIKNCVTKSSCCLARFRLIAMSFQSSTKYTCFLMVSRLIEEPIWNSCNFFNENDSGFIERMNINTEWLSPCKIPQRQRIGCDCVSPSWLVRCKFVNHFCTKVSIYDITSGCTFTNFKAIRSHSCSALWNAIWLFNKIVATDLLCFITYLRFVLLIISCSKQPQTSFLPPAWSIVTILLISKWSCKTDSCKK